MFITVVSGFESIKLLVTFRSEAPLNMVWYIGTEMGPTHHSPSELNEDAERVEHALHQIPHNPRPQRHARLLRRAQPQHRRADHQKRRVPQHVYRHHRPRVRPFALPLLHLRRSRLPHAHRSLSQHKAPPARAPEEAGRRPQRRTAGDTAALWEERHGVHRHRGSWRRFARVLHLVCKILF